MLILDYVLCTCNLLQPSSAFFLTILQLSPKKNQMDPSALFFFFTETKILSRYRSQFLVAYKKKYSCTVTGESRQEKTCFLEMRKQKHRAAVL